MVKLPGKLLWMDLEMTGLSPEEDRILEVACIVTDWKLNNLAEKTWVVKVSPALMKKRMVGKFWEKNRESYEALMAQNAEGLAVSEVEQEILEFMNEHFDPKGTDPGMKGGKGKVILAGNSIHQDRKFIDREMPLLSERLHYRMLDVSAFKVYFEGALSRKFMKREAHRALDDVRGSIEEFQYYLGFIK